MGNILACTEYTGLDITLKTGKLIEEKFKTAVCFTTV